MNHRDVRISPAMTAQQIAELCDKHDCHAVIEYVGGHVSAYLVKNSHDEIPFFLLKQAG